MRMATLLALFAASAVAAPVPKVKATDETAILGTWQGVSYDSGHPKGNQYVDAAEFKLIFEEGGIHRHIERKLEFRGTFKLDLAATPKAIDLCLDGTGKDGQSEEVLCVYDLDGDTLRVCFSEPNRSRPLSVKPNGTSEPLLTFKRVKDEPKKGK